MQNLIELLYSKFLLSDGVSIDTRKMKKGDLFFALSGPNFNGNQFAKEALEKGASFAVIDDDSFSVGGKTLVVPDSLKTLQDLSVFHRERIRAPVLAITGSNGKTTTKELIACVLSEKYKVHATQGNLNNHIGVPLTLLQVHPQVELAIIEMGASHVGDIAELCGYAQPTHGLITNIGHAHTETFGGIEGVLRGKTELFDFLLKTGGHIFLNTNDRYLENMKKRLPKVTQYPTEEITPNSTGDFIGFDFGGKTYTSKMSGAYNFVNIAAAFSVGRFFEVEDNLIVKALESYSPNNWRSQVIKKGDTTIILDAYNANPDSMEAALESFTTKKGRKAVVLGDMLELEDPILSHQKLGEFIADRDFDEILLVGENMKAAKSKLPMSHYFEDTRLLKEYVAKQDWNEFNVLLKGSRKMRLEEIVDHI